MASARIIDLTNRPLATNGGHSCAACVKRSTQERTASEERLAEQRNAAYDRAYAAERSCNRYRFWVIFAVTFIIGAILLYAAFVSVGGELNRRGAVMDYHRAEIAAVEAVMGE